MGAFAKKKNQNFYNICNMWNLLNEHQKAHCTGMEAFFWMFLWSVYEQICVCQPVFSHSFDKFFQKIFHVLFSDGVDVS